MTPRYETIAAPLWLAVGRLWALAATRGLLTVPVAVRRATTAIAVVAFCLSVLATGDGGHEAAKMRARELRGCARECCACCTCPCTGTNRSPEGA